MPFSFGETGTTFVGQRDYGKDGSYVTTEFAVLFCCPLFPITSLRVVELSQSGISTRYSVLSQGKVNTRQVLCVYGLGVLCVTYFITVISLVAD